MSDIQKNATPDSVDQKRFVALDFVGHDDWGRPVYRIIGEQTYLKDTELGQGRHTPDLHWSSPRGDFYGEPDHRWKPDKEFRFISTGGYELPLNAAMHNERLQEKLARGAEETTYKGIPLEELDKKTIMSHSRFLEKDEGVEWFDALLARDKSSLSPEQFQAISALNSVANMNYQICNGGLIQYFDNGYDRERAPFNADDVMQVNKNGQVEMLQELHAFARAVFPERKLENERLERIVSDFEGCYYEEEAMVWREDDEDEYGGYYVEEGARIVPADFDSRYYDVNDYLETVMEAYAQYLGKAIDRDAALESLQQTAKKRHADKNMHRPSPSDNRKQPDRGL